MPASGAIRAGRSYVEMFLDSSKLVAGLDKAKARLQAAAGLFAKIGVGAMGAGGSVLAPITKMFTDAVREGADVAQLAKRFHTSAESISTLRGAFAQAGVGAEEFGGILNGLSEKIAGAADSREELIAGLTGLRGDMLLGKGIDEQLDMIAEKFKTIKAREDEIRVANQLGLGGMIDYLKKGKEGMDELRAAALANGDAMSGEDAQAAATIMKEYNRTLNAVKSTLVAVGKALLPTGKDFAAVGKDIRDGLSDVRKWIAENKHIIVMVAGVAAGLVVAGAAFVGFATAMAIAAKVIAGVTAAISVVSTVLGLILSPIGIATAAIGALTLIWARTSENGKAFTSALSTGFSEAADTLKSGLGGVLSALKSGDWKLAGEMMMATLRVAWLQGIEALKKAWEAFRKSTIGSYIDTLTKGIGILTGQVDSKDVGNSAAEQDSSAGKARDVISKSVIGLGGIWTAITEGSIDAGKKFIQDVGETYEEDKKIARKTSEANRQKEAETAADELQQAKDAMEMLLQEARSAEMDAKIKSAREKLNAKGAEKPPTPPTNSQLAALAASQKGLTQAGGGLAQMALGVGDQMGQRQIDATNNVAAQVQQTNQILSKMPTPAFT